jgi:hypothetical protein
MGGLDSRKQKDTYLLDDQAKGLRQSLVLERLLDFGVREPQTRLELLLLLLVVVFALHFCVFEKRRESLVLLLYNPFIRVLL